MSSTMIIIRGIPGSGKSTVADALAAFHEDCIVCEADDFFYEETGLHGQVYKFKPELLDAAHLWCYDKAREGCMQNKTVIVSNTSALEKHVQKYIDLANDFGYNIQIITCQSTFKSIHALSEEAMDKFDKRMVYKKFNLK